MENISRALVAVALVLSLAFFASGCAQKKVQTEAEVAVPVESAKEEPAGAEKQMYESGMAKEVEPLESMPMAEEEPTILEGRSHAPMLPIYFDFDKSNIRDDQRDRLEKNADYLLANRMVRVRIEGNCDERGTNEYNMALGERRALSAKKYLINLGVMESRLETISYGEERPLQYGHDELSWAQNRRDDFVVNK